MTGDLAPPERPEFLPPEEPHGPWPAPAGVQRARPEPVRRGTAVWSVLALVAAAVMLVAAFLPWVTATYSVDFFGREIRRDAGTAAGIDADGTVLVVPVLALAAVLMIAWGLAGRDARIGALATVPGALSALGCLLFVLRLDRARRDLLRRDSPFGSYTVELGYGWYVALGAAVLLVLFAAVRPLGDRLSRRTRDGADASDRAASP
ncbi:hypothetical protein BTM25_29510 [Actinomadura rubteroloni]|uniref:Uncharacterized protein n=1 Tax=Actinomadura rubteroloni TaxID=1926885 RepID=A0A2P4UGX2_9ACTN|nr:hypothetical protein [Actinomadura rubteroloni]POM24322.1 hypothetical protein BTM25_29510 [Actinomadura rubteroloni]